MYVVRPRYLKSASVAAFLALIQFLLILQPWIRTNAQDRKSPQISKHLQLQHEISKHHPFVFLHLGSMGFKFQKLIENLVVTKYKVLWSLRHWCKSQISPESLCYSVGPSDIFQQLKMEKYVLLLWTRQNSHIQTDSEQ